MADSSSSPVPDDYYTNATVHDDHDPSSHSASELILDCWVSPTTPSAPLDLDAPPAGGGSSSRPLGTVDFEEPVPSIKSMKTLMAENHPNNVALNSKIAATGAPKEVVLNWSSSIKPAATEAPDHPPNEYTSATAAIDHDQYHYPTPDPLNATAAMVEDDQLYGPHNWIEDHEKLLKIVDDKLKAIIDHHNAVAKVEEYLPKPYDTYGVRFTEEEHKQFLLGVKEFGPGDWRRISRFWVTSRTPLQISGHAQSYFFNQRYQKKSNRDLVLDITSVDQETRARLTEKRRRFDQDWVYD